MECAKLIYAGKTIIYIDNVYIKNQFGKGLIKCSSNTQHDSTFHRLVGKRWGCHHKKTNHPGLRLCKIGCGSKLFAKLCDRIVVWFKINISQCKIANNLGLSPSRLDCETNQGPWWNHSVCRPRVKTAVECSCPLHVSRSGHMSSGVVWKVSHLTHEVTQKMNANISSVQKRSRHVLWSVVMVWVTCITL